VLLQHYNEQHSSFREDLLQKISLSSVPESTLDSLASSLRSLGFDVTGIPPAPQHCARCHKSYKENGPKACKLDHEWSEEAEFIYKTVSHYFSKWWHSCRFCEAVLSGDGGDFLGGKRYCFVGYHTQDDENIYKDGQTAEECRERGCPLGSGEEETDEEDVDTV
jgi:hypothetical protein